MSKKRFNEQEVLILKANPHVAKVTSKMLVFTLEFKALMYKELCGGLDIRSILENHGINTSALGTFRINGIVERLELEAKREEGFQNLRTTGIKQSPSKEKTLENRVKYLENKLAYAQQELEFLKKIQKVEMDMEKKCKNTKDHK